MSLQAESLRIKQMINSYTVNWTIFRMDDWTLQMIEDGAARGDAVLIQAERDLLAALAAIIRPDDYTGISRAFEIFEEALVYITLRGRNLPLRRTPGTGGHAQKRPDFQCDHPRGTFYVEVKTLDFQDGWIRHDAIANAGLDAKAELEGRARSPGVHVGTPVAISPHRPGATAADRIETAIKKIKGNIKLDQVTYGPTVLVVDTSRLSLDDGDPSALVPTYFHALPRSCVSGELWHIAFGRPEDLILARPEFEGKSNIDRRLRETGVYIDYPELMALAFVSRPLQGPPRIFSLRKLTPDFANVANPLSEDAIGDILHQLSDAGNDDLNEGANGKQLRP